MKVLKEDLQNCVKQWESHLNDAYITKSTNM